MKISTLLSVILAVQLLLAAGIGWGRYQAGSDVQPRDLLDFEISAVDRIELDDNTNETTLEKSGGDWVLPDLHALTANQARVNGLLDTLSGLETGWPVATTQSGIERMEVGEDNYQRRLRLMAGDDLLGEYYFGTSPGLRQTHGRRAGEGEVYALGINNFDMPGDANDWLDKTLLGVEMVTMISGADFSIKKGEEDTWRFDHVESGEQSLDPDKVTDLVSALERLRVLRVAEALPESDPVTLTVGSQEQRWIYRFYSNESDDDTTYYVQRDDMNAGFTISMTTYDRIAGIARDDLLAAPEADAESGEEEAEAV